MGKYQVVRSTMVKINQGNCFRLDHQEVFPNGPQWLKDPSVPRCGQECLRQSLKKKRKEKLMRKPREWNEFDVSMTWEKSNVTRTVAFKGSLLD